MLIKLQDHSYQKYLSGFRIAADESNIDEPDVLWSVLFQRILEKVQQLLVELSEIEIDDINVNDGFGVLLSGCCSYYFQLQKSLFQLKDDQHGICFFLRFVPMFQCSAEKIHRGEWRAGLCIQRTEILLYTVLK